MGFEAKDNQAKDKLVRRLSNATLVLDARLGGLSRDGLLDDAEGEPPQTIDDGAEWLPPVNGSPAVRFRVRTAEESTTFAVRGWRHRLRIPIERSEEGIVQQWLVVEKWRSDSGTADDGAAGALQTLSDHQSAAVSRAGVISSQLQLPTQFAKMLEFAARLHDEGKRAENWQKAFQAPSEGGPFAKTPGPINQSILGGYRHEFSSLAALVEDAEFQSLGEDLQDLALHVVAAHHGFARPLIGTSGCADAPPSLLEERARQVALRFIRVQRRWSPWGLAWWEALLRAVDQQASREWESNSEALETATSALNG